MTHAIAPLNSRRWLGPWLGLATAAALWLAQPSTAAANGVISPTVDNDTAAGSVVLYSSVIAFGGLDLLYLAHDKPMPIGLTAVQILVGGILVPLGASRANNQGLVLGAAISSAWFIGHGVYSTLFYLERERERERALAANRAWHSACTREPEPHSLLCSRSR